MVNKLLSEDFQDIKIINMFFLMCRIVVQRQIAEDGTVQETVIHANGRVEKYTKKAGMDDK